MLSFFSLSYFSTLNLTGLTGNRDDFASSLSSSIAFSNGIMDGDREAEVIKDAASRMAAPFVYVGLPFINIAFVLTSKRITVDSRSNVFSVKFVARVKCCYSHCI